MPFAREKLLAENLKFGARIDLAKEGRPAESVLVGFPLSAKG